MPMHSTDKVVHYHLPGLFEFFDLYSVFLPLYYRHREYFYEWCNIGSLYGAPCDYLWGGGRISSSTADSKSVLNMVNEYNLSARLTFSNSLLTKEHLADKKCNDLCSLFSKTRQQSGVIVHSDVLAEYLHHVYPNLYLVSSTTKVLTDFDLFKAELDRSDFAYVVLDFRLNKEIERLNDLSQFQKDKTEFLCNECCNFECKTRKLCYEVVSLKNLGKAVPDFRCSSPDSEKGYRFSKAMKNAGFIGIQDIQETYVPKGFSNFKIEGRGLGSAIVLEFLLYYMTKPEHQLEVREAVYLDAMLDLF